MDAESKMWLEQLQRANPQWNLALGKNFVPGQGILATDAYVYVVDTHTGWMAGAATSSSELARIRAQIDRSPGLGRQALDACASAIADVGGKGARTDSVDAERCILLAVSALAQTQTWQEVLRVTKGSLAGHWLYVVYKPRNGPGAIGRPGYAISGKPGFLEHDRLNAAIAQMLRADTSGETNVGRMLAEDGGAVLSESFERLRRGEAG